MSKGLIAFALIVVFMLGGLLAFRSNARLPLPKNLPPPLKDENDEDEESK
jgi:hypothetical protein